MKKFFLSTLFSLSILQASPPLNLFEIDASTRGADFVAAVKASFTAATTNGEVVIQTNAMPPYANALYVNNGLIPNVQNSITAATNNTLFIIPYNQPNSNNGYTINTQFIVVGIEQIVTIAYQNISNPTFETRGQFSNPPNFTSLYPNNVLPLYEIDPGKRAADIVSIVNSLLTAIAASNTAAPPTASFTTFNATPTSQVWILPTLNGPYPLAFSANFVPGAIANVTAIALIGTGLLQITYSPQSPATPNINQNPQQGSTISLILAAEQVEQIIYYQNFPP